MRDDRITGYSTENVAPLTPPDLELLGSLARQLPRVGPKVPGAIRGRVIEPTDTVGILRITDSWGSRLIPVEDAIDHYGWSEATETELTCPIRGCEGHEGPHGSLFGARVDE